MTGSVGLYCKSFRDDFAPLSHLLDTFARHNPARLTLTLSLPGADIPLFENLRGRHIEHVEVIADESYSGTVPALEPGWFSQQICKLLSWRAMACEHYLVLDSDCYFLRDIYHGDIAPAAGKQYVACGSTLRTVLYERNEDLLAYIEGTLNRGTAWLPRKPSCLVDRLDKFIHDPAVDSSLPDPIRRSDIAFKTFGRRDWVFFQPGQIFSRRLLEQLNGYFDSHGLTARQAIRICPWEYNWYGEFTAARHFDSTEFRISPFLHFQSNADVEFARHRGITASRISAKFLLIQMAARHVEALWL